MPWEIDIPDVIAGQPITSAWGNSIRDSVVHTVASVAALPSTGISNGDVAYVTAINRLVTRTNNRWYLPISPFTGLAKTTAASGQADITPANVGLVEITSGTAWARWVAGFGSVAVMSSSRFISGPNLELRVFQVTTGAVANYAGSVTVDGYVSGYLT